MTKKFSTNARFGRLLGVGSLAAIALSSASAMAQEREREQEQAEDSGTIYVTAQFREQRLQDTPIAITAISGDDIENQALNDISAISASAPNVNITQTSSAYGGAAIYIRGIGQYDSNFALEPGVGVYIDNVYHGTLVGSLFDLLDLQRVEILRGPQGTLAGKNSIGGAVRMFSREPQGTNDGFIQATVGSFDRMEVRGAFDIALSDQAALRVSAFGKRRDGHVRQLDFACDQPDQVLPTDTFPTQVTSDNCQVGTLGGINSMGARAALRLQPTEAVEINLIASIIRDDSQGAGVEQVGTADTRFIPDRPYVFYGTFTSSNGWQIDSVATTEYQSISGQVDIELTENLELTSITAYEDLYSEWSIDGDGGPLGTAQTLNRSPYHQFTQELRLNGEIGDGLVEYTVGGFYFDSLGHVGARVYSFPALNFIQNDPVSNRSTSAFAHLIVHPVPNMSITGGIRYTDDKKTYSFVRLDPVTGLPAPIVGPLNGVSSTYSGDNLDLRLGVDYRFSDELLVYGSFATGYKGGGINPRPFIPSQVVGFDPETVDAYELGFKSDLLGGMLRVNVAAFLNEYQDIILIDANGFPGAPGDPGYFFLSAAPFNAGDATIRGLELETTLRPADGLEIDGSLSYLDFEYKNLDANAVGSGITTNFRAPFTPEWKWSIGAQYEIPVGNASITPRFAVEYMDDVFTDPVNAATNNLPSRTLVNANVTYRSPDESWEVALGVTNLFDELYYSNAFDITSVNGNNTWVVGRPREAYLSLRRNF